MKKVEQSFRRSLKTYDTHAYVQLEIAETLAKLLLEECGDNFRFSRAFEIGCGTGFLSKSLFNYFKFEHIDFNDLVSECEPLLHDFMKQASKQTCQSWDFVAGDINRHEFTATYDLIFSASTLQWVFELPELIDKVKQALTDNGWVAFSCFGSQHFKELRQVNKQLEKEISPLNYPEESQWEMLLSDDFDIKQIQSNTVKLWFDSFEQLLLHLRNTGVNGNSRNHWSQSQLKEFASLYQSSFEENGKLPLSYEPIFIIAKHCQTRSVT